MPFGLRNTPAFFMLMRQILGNFEFSQVYIDDIVIFSDNVEEHLDHLKQVFDKLREYNLKLNPEKCNWMKESIKILGHIIDKDGIKMDPEIIKAIKNFKKPKTLKQLQTFLGLANYYRRFVEGYAKIAPQLHALQSPKVQWIWSDTLHFWYRLRI
ncbi:unnamed protein product [Brachionus calyciflorus]|uniref:Reverse transcriptase domain-containing protein n=1 Tax=Brachionus calyciflorus TaxID=104777 RepID=A0A814I9B6_9BILA|nr:unnamed protein product [Brachionus calyciflorus]